MSEPIPDVAGIPDVIAARALPALVELLYTDPIARPLLPSGGRVPMYFIRVGGLSIRCSDPDAGAEQLAAARALFGGKATPAASYDHDIEGYNLATSWQGVPLRVSVEIRRENEVAELRKQVADLQAAQGRLVEQRHQLLDPAVPPLSAAGPDVPPLELTTVQAPAELAVAE
jgi:hypothetical protein